MNKKDIWRKAAVLGSLWAAFEIVLGSFLHNARIPFRGHILTSIGIAILISGYRLWHQKGILWRAGLICSAMKTISPSPFILGPMIAIFMEGLLLELGIRLTEIFSGLFGKRNKWLELGGFLFAGGLSMSWAFFQKIGNILIFYGPDTISLYIKGLDYIKKWLNFQKAGLLFPLVLVFIAHFLLGCFAAFIGFRVLPEKKIPCLKKNTDKKFEKKSFELKEKSLTALVLNLIFIMSLMAFSSKISILNFLLISAFYSGISILSCPEAMKIFKKIKLWTGIFLVSIFAGVLLGKIEAGIYMSIRAFVLTIGFAVITHQLRNPKLRIWIERITGPLFFEALEYSFNALPQIFVNIPQGKEILKNPVKSLGEVISCAPYLLESFENQSVFIITGKHNSGKSSMVEKISNALREKGLKVAGILSAGVWENGEKIGFDVLDLFTQKKAILCRKNGNEKEINVGQFYFYPEGLKLGKKALSISQIQNSDIVFIDEIGFLELEGKGWAECLDELFKSQKTLVIVVRDYLVEKVIEKWNLKNPIVLEIDKNFDIIFSKLFKMLTKF